LRAAFLDYYCETARVAFPEGQAGSFFKVANYETLIAAIGFGAF
jgi:hypothetical protein